MFFRFGILAIIGIIFFLVHIYLTINSTEKNDNNDNNTIISTNLPITVYVCPQFPLVSKGYFRVDFTDKFSLDYNNICKSDDILLIYILSKIDHIERRQAIRRTWANKNQYVELYRICFIFLIGLTNNITLNSYIHSEALLYNDIVQVNINETYQNIVYKEVAGLKWSHIYASHIPYLFKTDDDIIIDTILLGSIAYFFNTNRTIYDDYMQNQDKIKDFINTTGGINKHTLFKGIYINGHKAIRRGKFALDNLAWNDNTLPGYCRGSGYMFSSFIRDRLYRASLCYAIEYVPWAGDVFVSGFLASVAAVQCSPWSMEYVQSHDGCSLRFQNQARLLICSTPMHSGRLYMDDYDQTWTTILHRHSITNETIEQGKKQYFILLKEQAKEKLPINESIIEQIKNNSISREEPIVPLNKMVEKLD